MLRDVFYFGKKPNVHPREKFAKNLQDARKQCVTEHFWVINEFCDYKNFDWDFDFEYLPDDEVWTQEHNNVWPSNHQKDSGTWLCYHNHSDVIIYRNDVNTLKRFNIDNENWRVLEKIDNSKWDFSWHPDPTDPPYIYVWGNQWYSGKIMPTIEYYVSGATEKKYMDAPVAELMPAPNKFDIFEQVESFDFSWVPNPTSPPYVYVWGNQWNKPEDKISVQYAVEGATEYKFMPERLIRKADFTNWILPKNADVSNFDFSWEPSPADPPYIYEFGTQWQKTGGPRYVVEGATEVKYIDIQKVKALPTLNNWTIPNNLDITNFDFSWHPDSTSPPYVYHFATQWALTGGPIYTCEGATEVKYLDTPSATALPDKTNWIIPTDVDVESFDFSWHPYVEDQPYIYVFGTQWQKTGGPKYVTPGVVPGSPIKYIDRRILQSKRLPNKNKFAILNNCKIKEFDWSWHPDDTEEPFIYIFGNTLYPAEVMPTIEYKVQGAKQVKFINDIVATLDVDMTNWEIPDNIDISGFDFSWRPNPNDPPYIYVFGTQHQKTGGPVYVVPDATERKYVDTQKVKALSNKNNWEIPNNVDTADFDFSWHPDDMDPPYIYVFGTQWALSGGPRYVVVGATEIKYMDTMVAKALPNREHWIIPPNIDVDSFDFSWHPYAEDEPYIYVFGTQHQKTGGPKYMTPGTIQTSPISYIDTRILKAKRLPNKKNFAILNNYKIKDFDFSWHPDETEDPYIYVFGNNQYSAEVMPTIEYVVPGAKQIKYVNNKIATLDADKTNWVITQPIDENKFDYSWKPNPNDPPYIYRWGNKYVSGKYKSTIDHVVPDATEIKYMTDDVEVLPEWDRWEIPKNIDKDLFDFSWRPDPLEPDFIWEFGTQWQPSGGPKYIVPGGVAIKYTDAQKAKALPTTKYWEVPDNLDISEFDFSWHPDNVDKPYIYQFGTQWALSGGPRYVMPNATEVKYIENPIAKAAPNKTNWIIPDDIDSNTFDFSWHPYAEDEPYIYQFGTQHQKTGGPKYIATGADESSFTKYIDTRILKATKLSNKSNFKVIGDYKIKDFDYSWHPDETEQPYIYMFGTTLYPAEVMPVLEYRVPNATQIKYVNTVAAILDADRTNWEVSDDLDVTDFDFGWRPNPNDPPYIYEFGTQWQKTGGPKYIVPGATELKYVDSIKAKRKPNSKGFDALNNFIIEEFDYSWHPDDTEEPYIYIFGNQWNDGVLEPTVEYRVEGATQIKYINNPVAKVGHARDNFEIIEDIESFDFSWRPNPTDPPYIYVFGNTQYPGTVMPTVKYMVSGATQEKFIDDVKAKLAQKPELFVKKKNIKDFDYSWRPDPNSPPYIYVFGNQWYSAEKDSTIEYHEENAIAKKYINDVVATIGPNLGSWNIPDNIDTYGFDFSWYPDPHSPPYIYQFGTQHQKTGGPVFVVKGATEIKYIDTFVAKALPNPNKFKVLDKIVVKDFDYSWHPDASEEPYIYVFGNNQYPAKIMPTVEYKVQGATQVKYIDTVKAILGENLENWDIPETVDVTDFDFSWVPNPKDPPYVYQFGTIANDNDGPKYNTPNTSGEMKYLPWVRAERKNDGIKNIDFIEVKKYYIETTLEDLANQHPTEVFWALNRNIDYSSFDFSWRPQIIHVGWEADYVNVFGSPESPTTHTYFINAKSYLNGKKDFKFIEDVKLNEDYLSKLFVKPEMFFVDRGNSEAMDRFTKLKEKFGNIQKTRYLNSWVDTINRCINRSSTTLCWILDSYLDYSDFNFNYYPNPWQMKMVHIFGTQWSHWGTTFMVNRETFAQDTKYIKIIEHLNNINFVKRNENIASATNCLYDVYVIDHGNKETSKVIESIKDKVRDKSVTPIPYKQNYLDTFKEILKKVPEKRDHYVWICSSICDYSNFNFTYICDPFARENLHVFPSNKQKFGDTFLVNINQLNLLINNMNKLQEYNKISFNNHQRVQRLSPPVIVSDYDTHVASVLTDYEFPYAIFVTEDNKDIETIDEEPINLWAEDTKNILITSTGGTRIVAPKEVKNFVETQLYDYPYIITSKNLTKSSPMDIVFVSNGELCAETNYEQLLKISKNFENKIVRIDGINGRSEALKAAAKSSSTKWFYGVPAKLLLDENFDFNYQPDRLQIPKHYVFKAHNPINDLYYGHQAMVLYNKEIVLNVTNPDLDFTIESEHDVVNLNSGTAVGDTDEYSTWRTAFREAIKLQRYYDTNKDKISKQRLEIWTSIGKGNFGEWSIKGANDGIEFYKEVNGNINELRQSYYWDWIEKRFKTKY